MPEVDSETRGRNKYWVRAPMRLWCPPACPSLSPQSLAWLGDPTSWSFPLKSCTFRARIAVLILDMCLAVMCSFGYASALRGDSKSSKISRAWQSSHSGATLFFVVQSLLWGIRCQNRQMDVGCFAILALPLFPVGWDATTQVFKQKPQRDRSTGDSMSGFWLLDNKAYTCTPGWK